MTTLNAPTYADSNNVGALTNQILASEIKLEKLNTDFRRQTSLVSPFRQRRMFAYSQANAVLTEAALIEQMRIRYNLARQKVPKGSKLQFDPDEELPEAYELPPPGKSNSSAGGGLTGAKFQSGSARGRLANATEAQIIGQAIGGTGDIIEIGLNYFNYLKLRHRGLTPSEYRKQIRALQNELNQLIEARDNAIGKEPVSSSKREVFSMESKLISDFRDLELGEYGDFHIATKRFWVYQNTAYLVDLLRNSLGMTGNIIGLTGNHLRRPRMQGGAGVFAILNGCVVLITPSVGRVTGNLSGVAARKLVSNDLRKIEVTDLNIFAADRQKLLTMIKAIHDRPFIDNLSDDPSDDLSDIQPRLFVYESMEKLLQDTNKYQERQRQRARATLIENILFAGLVGPPRITNGITQVLGGWRYYTNPPLANKLYSAGATAYAAGTGINIAETARLQASFEWQRWRQKKTHTTPSETFKKRLKILDQMNGTLLSSKQSH